MKSLSRLFAPLVVAIAAFVVPVHAAPASRPVTVTLIHMISPTVGWGISTHGIVRTIDGGVHWTEMRPAGLPNTSPLPATLASIGPDRAWVEVDLLRSNDNGPPHSLVFSTVDAGRHWRRSNLIRGVGYGWRSASIDFVDARHGWILNTEGAAMEHASYDLYRSSDGGLHWYRVAYANPAQGPRPGGLPTCDCLGGISFRTPQIGWLTGSFGVAPNQQIFYHSHDGGRTWHQMLLPLPQGFSRNAMLTAPPAFFGQDGVLPVAFMQPNAFVIYLTHNGGASWFPTRPLYQQHGAAGIADAFALTPLDVWAWVRGTVYRSQDGGQHWTALSRPALFGDNPELDFVSATVGYAVPGPGTAAQGPPYVLKTADGGRSWFKVHTVTG